MRPLAFWVLALLFAFTAASVFAYQYSATLFVYPLVHMIVMAFSSFVAFNVAFVVRQAHRLSRDVSQFFLSLGLFVLAALWLENALLTPPQGMLASALFLCIKILGPFLAAVLFVSGIVLRRKEKLFFTNREELFYLFSVLTLIFVIITLAVPFLSAIEHAVNYLPPVSFILLFFTSFSFWRSHVNFRGLHYDSLSAVMLLLASSQIGFFFSEVWTLLWWLSNTIVVIAFVMLLVVFLRSYAREQYFDDKIRQWSAGLESPGLEQ